MPRRPSASITTIAVIAFAVSIAASAADAAPTQAGGGCNIDAGAGYTEGTATVVRMDACSFEPTVVRVPVGTTVRFLNTAPNDHVVTGRRNTWGSEDILAPGAELSERFTTAGVYPYTCTLHPGMVGAVIVGEAGPAVGSGTVEEPPVAPASSTTGVPVGFAVLAGAVGGALIGVLATAAATRRRSTPARGAVAPTSAFDR